MALHIEQLYLGCLAQASYLLTDSGEAAVIDPRRDVDDLVARLLADGLSLRWIVETHLHADFVSGHHELAAKTGATIVFGKAAGATFEHRAVSDGDTLPLGTTTLEVLETPGHTPESICLVAVEGGIPKAVFTGDTLFVGDVGRPDLVGSRGRSAEEMASLLHDSLHGKLLTLPDDVLVYPAHGAGSLCGKNISKETSSTIGKERRFNVSLQPMSKEAFVKMATTNLPEVPAYFGRDVALNRGGARSLGELPAPEALTPAAVSARVSQGALVLDIRPATDFAAGHVPGSVNIGLVGDFAVWSGALLSPETPIVLVLEDERSLREAVTRLARVGLENVTGYLAGGFAAWREDNPVATLPRIAPAELESLLANDPDVTVLDVRRPPEYESCHVPGAVSVPLDRLESRLASFDAKRRYVVVCAGGYRSAIASSLLLRAGFPEVSDVLGGTGAYASAGCAVERAVPAAAS